MAIDLNDIGLRNAIRDRLKQRLRDRLTEKIGVPAVRGVYGMDQVGEPATNAPIAPTAGTLPTPQIMSAHERVGTPNVNPFQDDFTPNTNTMSMQEIAGQVAPQPDQPIGERLARGAANIPIGMAGMAEQATSDPLAFLKSTGEYAATWAKRLNPVMSPETAQARAEWGQQVVTDPVGSGLDALGVVGTAVGLPKLGGKIRGAFERPVPEIIRNAVQTEAVPEVIQKAVTPETPKPNAVTSSLRDLTPDQVTEIQRRLRERAAPTPEPPSTPPVEKPVVAETPMANGTGGETAYQKFIREGGKESEWDAFRNSKNIESRNASTERTVSQWSSGGELSGNDIVNFATSRGEKISEKVRKALQDDDTVVSNKSLTGRGFTRSEAKKLHSEVSMMMNDLAAKHVKPTTAEAVVKKAGEKKPVTVKQAASEIKQEAATTKLTDKSFKSQMKSEIEAALKDAPDRPQELQDMIDSYNYADEKRGGMSWERKEESLKAQRENINDLRKKLDIKTVTIEIPDDGTFTVEHTKQALQELNKRLGQNIETKVRQETSTPRGGDRGLQEATIGGYNVQVFGDQSSIRPSGTKGISTIKVDYRNDPVLKKLGVVSNDHYLIEEPALTKHPKQILIKDKALDEAKTKEFISGLDKIKFDDNSANEIVTYNDGLNNKVIFDNGELSVGFSGEYIEFFKSNVKNFSLRLSGETTPAAIMSGDKRVGVLMPLRTEGQIAITRPTTAEAVVKKAGEKVDRIQLKKLDERIARQQKIMERTKPQWDKQGEIPGPLMTGRSGYKMGKKLDAQNDRMSKAFTEYKQAEREYKSLTQRREAFLRGDVHYNGQPTASSRNKGNYAQSQFDKIEVGDMIDIGGNAPLKVIKKNRATVVTESGGKWSANQIGEVIKKSDTPPPTELHAGVNPFRIMGDALKRVGFDSDKLKKNFANPLGTPEIVLKDTGIVEPFRRETGLMNTALKQAQVRLDGLLKGVTRNSQADMDLFNKLDNPNAKLSHSEQGIRDYLNETLVKINDARKARGQAEIPYRAGYITHLIENMPKEFAADLEIPKSLRFRFAKRKGAYGHKVSAVEALQTYTQAALRDIHVGNALYEASPALEKLTGRKFMWESTTKNAQGQPVTNTFKQIADAPFFTKAGYARSFVERQLGWPTKAARDIEALTGIRAQTTQRAALKVTSTFYNSLLGLALDSGVKNLTQGVHTVAELNLAPTLKGYAKLATPKGFKAAKAEHLLHEFEPFLLTESLPIRSQVGKVAASVLQAPMKFAEFVNRGAAFHAAMDVGIKKGMSPQAAHDFARGIVRKTQFAYGKMDVSPFMQGAVTRPLAQFMTFPAKAGEMLWQYGKTAGERGKLLRYLAVTGAIIMGGKYVGVDMSGIFIDPTKLVDPDSKQGVPLPGSDKRIGIDLSRMGKTGWTPQGVAPVPSIIANAIKYAKEDDPNKKEALGKNTLRSIIPGGRYGGKVYDVLTGDGEVRDSRDRLMRKESGADAFMKLAGFKSTDREVEQSKRESVVEIERDYNMRRQAIVDTIISGDSKKASEMINELLADYPYLGKNLRDTLKDAVKGESKKKEMTSEQRFFNTKTRQLIQANQ